MKSDAKTIQFGGVCLMLMSAIGAGVAIIVAWLYGFPGFAGGHVMMANFHIFAKQAGLQQILTAFSLLPLFLIPGSIGLYYFLRDEHEGRMRIAMVFALFAAFAWILSNLFWPSINAFVVRSMINVRPYHDPILFGLTSGIYAFFHVFLGEYLRMFALSIWFYMVGTTASRSNLLPSWLCYLGRIFAVIIWIGLILRMLVIDPNMIDHGFNFFPLVNFWIFLVGAYMLAVSSKTIKKA